MTIKEIIQRVQSLYSKGVQSDDTRLSGRHIFNKLNSTRSLVLKRKEKEIGDSNYQYIDCIEVIKAPIHECPCIPAIGCCFYRTKYKIPALLTDSMGKEMIINLSSLDSNTQFSQWEWKDFKWKKGEKYTQFKPDFFIKNEYIYFTQRKSIQEKVVTLQGLFENPLLAYIFNSENTLCPSECVDYLELEYPLQSSLIDMVIEMVVKELIQIFNSGIEDSTNDTRDNITTQTK